jgi:hypothetical protein
MQQRTSYWPPAHPIDGSLTGHIDPSGQGAAAAVVYVHVPDIALHDVAVPQSPARRTIDPKHAHAAQA